MKKKHILLAIVISILLSACAKLQTPTSSDMTIQERKQKSIQCHELKRIMATGTTADQKAAYRESKAKGCNN